MRTVLIRFKGCRELDKIKTNTMAVGIIKKDCKLIEIWTIDKKKKSDNFDVWEMRQKVEDKDIYEYRSYMRQKYTKRKPRRWANRPFQRLNPKEGVEREQNENLKGQNCPSVERIKTRIEIWKDLYSV